MDCNYVGSLKRHERLHSDFINIWEEIKNKILGTSDIHYLNNYEVTEDENKIKVVINNCLVYIKFIQNVEFGGVRYFSRIDTERSYTFKDIFFDNLGNLQEELNFYHVEEFGNIHMMILAEIYPDIIQKHYS